MKELNLTGTWQATNAAGDVSVKATVPGTIHHDLLKAGRIEDPFYRDNEDRLQWIGKTDWTFAREFAVPADFLSSPRVLLRCEGLDTLATVVVNGKEIGRTDNMYRTYEFDVREFLRDGTNIIAITFASTIPVIQARQAEHRIPSWSGPKEVSGRAWIRKQPCNYGWDWGPTLVTCGIWRPIRVLAVQTARVTDVSTRQDHRPDGSVALRVDAGVETVATQDLEALATVSLDGKVVTTARAVVRDGRAGIDLVVQKPKLWWPNGMGAQPLYDVRVDVLDGAGAVIDTASRRVGLRTLRLDRHADTWGESFQFVANGVPFFAKGANWIPADAILSRMTRTAYEDLLRSAAAAHMNMLRVWGGGIYENDAFYDLCDELGLCIWQDFMFACSTYPTFDDAFLATVRAEAEDNVRRLRHHPCLALWCGNNELEQGLVGEAWNERQMSWEDYGRLFDRLLPEVIRALDPDRDYWPCSPHTPHGDRKDFNNPTCGDAHLWSVWHGRQPFEWYRTCTHRFNSEFGFQSFPEPKTALGYTAPADRNVTTYVMEHHQRSGIGNTVIMQYMLDWFRLPTSFPMTLWLSQILQGMAIKYAVEHWRRGMPRGMGTLYWQLNDCWPVASWASVDYHGRWKALHYMARNFFAPRLISGLEDVKAGTVELHVTNDLEAFAGTAEWTLTDLEGKRLAVGKAPVKAVARASQLVQTLDLKPHLETHGPRGLLLWCALRIRGAVVATNLVLLARPKHLELQPPDVKARVRKAGDNAYTVTLTCAKPALWTWLEMSKTDARFSDNFVHLRSGEPVEIVATPSRPLTPDAFKRQLRVHSLIDTFA